MKHLLALASLCILLVGCTGPTAPLGQSFVRTAASTGVAVGLEGHPEATPYVKTASLVVCAAANSTNIIPSQIVEQLDKSGVGTNQWAKLIINGVLGLYTSIYAYYGDTIANQPVLVGYLHALCDGMNDGLPEPPTMARALEVFHAKHKLPPHLK